MRATLLVFLLFVAMLVPTSVRSACPPGSITYTTGWLPVPLNPGCYVICELCLGTVSGGGSYAPSVTLVNYWTNCPGLTRSAILDLMAGTFFNICIDRINLASGGLNWSVPNCPIPDPYTGYLLPSMSSVACATALFDTQQLQTLPNGSQEEVYASYSCGPDVNCIRYYKWCCPSTTCPVPDPPRYEYSSYATNGPVSCTGNYQWWNGFTYVPIPCGPVECP